MQHPEPEREPRLARVLERNVAALIARREAAREALGWQERLAQAISTFAGSMTFVWCHVVLFAAWIAVNVIPATRFDASFAMLAMVASVEAIFLSTFILITQNRMQAQADRRAELNLQISLLAEHEVTRLMQLVSAIADRVGVPAGDPEMPELQRDVRPEQVLETIERHEGSPADR